MEDDFNFTGYHASMPATLVQVSTSRGGMPKLAVPQAMVTRDAVGDDWQLNRKYHGGCARAVCLYSTELYDWLARPEQIGIRLAHGSIGENFTTTNIDLLSLVPDDRLRVGECLIEVVGVRVPCKSLNQWHPNLLEVIRDTAGGSHVL